ncbi:MAG: hypothetical protein LBJ86_05760 [Spirochaetaceae bacterium]|jgi:hypothetical protein|nr:hypothetical protein [Spirochaetaceae bacterium]
MMKKTVFGLTIAVMVVAAGCVTQSGAESTSARQAAQADVKWENDSGGYLTVNNNVNEPLVLFAGTIVNQHILGGVRALASRRVDFFDKLEDSSGTFLLRAVKESVYRSKGSGLNSDDIIFAGLVVFDKSTPRAIQVNINQSLGGAAYVIIQNDTSMALQIRVDRPDGPTLTTLAPLERNKKVYMEPNPDGYFFFPVYEYYDRSSMGIRSITARNLADGIPMMPVVPGPGRDAPVITFDSKPANLFSPFATLIVTNETNRGGYLLEGSSRKSNQNGTTMINPGSETYELNLQKQPRLRIGGLSVDLSLGAANVIRIPEFDYEASYNYQVRIRQDGAAPEVIRLGKSDNDDFSIQLVNER